MTGESETARASEAARIPLRLLATSDLHACLRAYDYCADRVLETVGLTRVAALIGGARTESANTLLFDNGDLLQGNPLGDLLAGDDETGERNAIIAAMNAIGVDAATVGNHDFNFGLDYLLRALGDADYPVVCANIVRRRGSMPEDDTLLMPPWTILDRRMTDTEGRTHDIRVGVIGLTPPQTVLWEGGALDGAIEARDVLDAARHHLPLLRAAGADLIVALAHGGLGLNPRIEGPENVSLQLAQLDEIDALVMGHVHDVFPPADPSRAPQHPAIDPMRGTVAGKPAVMPGHRGSHLGVIDLALERTGPDAPWRVTTAATHTRPIAARNRAGRIVPLVAKDARIEALTRPAHLRTLDHLRQIVARTEQPLFSHFTMIGHDPALRTVTAAMRHFLSERLSGTPYGHLPVLAAAAQLKAGERGGPEYFTEVEAGEIALRDLSDIYPFPDRLHALMVTGAELRAWLEFGADSYNHVPRGSHDACLIDNRIPGYLRDTIDGLHYHIDLSQNPAQGRRIQDLSHDGAPLRDDQHFILATNNHRASGGGGFPGTGPGRSVVDFRETIPQIVRHFLSSGRKVTRNAWHFAPMAGTSVRFRTGPNALRYVDRLADRRVEHLGRDDEGFALFRLHL